jgi:hypothetical protein
MVTITWSCSTCGVHHTESFPTGVPTNQYLTRCYASHTVLSAACRSPSIAMENAAVRLTPGPFCTAPTCGVYAECTERSVPRPARARTVRLKRGLLTYLQRLWERPEAFVADYGTVTTPDWRARYKGANLFTVPRLVMMQLVAQRLLILLPTQRTTYETNPRYHLSPLGIDQVLARYTAAHVSYRMRTTHRDVEGELDFGNSYRYAKQKALTTAAVQYGLMGPQVEALVADIVTQGMQRLLKMTVAYEHDVQELREVTE